MLRAWQRATLGFSAQSTAGQIGPWAHIQVGAFWLEACQEPSIQDAGVTCSRVISLGPWGLRLTWGNYTHGYHSLPDLRWASQCGPQPWRTRAGRDIQEWGWLILERMEGQLAASSWREVPQGAQWKFIKHSPRARYQGPEGLRSSPEGDGVWKLACGLARQPTLKVGPLSASRGPQDVNEAWSEQSW